MGLQLAAIPCEAAPFADDFAGAADHRRAARRADCRERVVRDQPFDCAVNDAGFWRFCFLLWLISLLARCHLAPARIIGGYSPPSEAILCSIKATIFWRFFDRANSNGVSPVLALICKFAPALIRTSAVSTLFCQMASWRAV